MRDPNRDSGPSNFLGTGWKFPPRLDAHGRIALVQHDEDIKEAIRIILLTNKGERRMRPEFGSDLSRLQFEPNDSTTCGLASRYIQEALARWEPRIAVEAVHVEPGEDSAQLLIDIQYRILATNSTQNLVFPFYTMPDEE